MIKIEVTGASIPEVADKLIAIGRSLQQSDGVALFSAPHPVNASVSAPEDISPAALEEVEVEVAEEAPAPLPSSGQTEAPQPTEEKASASSPTEASDAPAELNFDTDVAPYVLQVVKEKGKPVAQEILSQFGVEKASLLDPSRWPELVSLLKEQL
jgi:hypothetical protein